MCHESSKTACRFAATSAMTGQEMTAGGLAGAAVSGAIGGALTSVGGPVAAMAARAVVGAVSGTSADMAGCSQTRS